MPYLVLLNEDNTTTTLKISKERTTLGSKSENDLVAPMKGVSRHHAHIVQENGQFILEDLDSTNFVFVNSQQVDRHVLKDRTVFGLGDYAVILFLENFEESAVEEFLKKHSKNREPTTTTRIFHTNLPKSVKELEILIELGATISSSLDLDTVLHVILEKAMELMAAERGFIMLLENGVLVPKVARNMNQDLVEDERYSYSQSFAEKSIEKGETIISTNVAEDPRYKSASIISHKILSIMSSPLRIGEDTIGCLYVDVRQTNRYFSQKDASFFTALANQAAIAIHNATLTENLKKNQIFLEQTNNQLQRSLEKLIETNLKLERQRNELEVLYEVSRSLNMASDMESILRLCLSKTRQILGAERGSLMMYDEKLGGLIVRMVDGAPLLRKERVVLRLGEGIAGTVAKLGRGIITNEGVRDARFLKVYGRDANIRQLICVPLISGDSCLGVMNLVNNMQDQKFTNEDLNIVSSIANLAAVSIEKVRVDRERLQQEKLNQEIEDAQKVQQLLLPKEMPAFPNFEFSAKYALANRVGGDYYDFIPIDENRLAIVIADVSGHDIASALVMAMGRNLIRTFFGSHVSPAEILSKTSMILREDTQSQRYITMFLGVLDRQKMSLTYSNGGHNYPLYLKAGAAEFTSLSVGGFPLGLLDDYNYLEETLTLSPGDLLILYTDGLIEAQSPTNEMFELNRLEKIVLDYRTSPIDEMTSTIYERALAFSQQEKLQDDFTFVALRARSPARELHVEFPSELEQLSSQVERLASFIQTEGLFQDEDFNLTLVLKEALTNAIEHGNRLDPKKKVTASVVPTPREVSVVIRDEGNGFDRYSVLSQGRKNLFKERGRGLIIINEYADKVEWNEKGNSIRIIFYRPDSQLS